MTDFPQGHRVVLTYGTFDMLHIGHLNLLRRLRELGDKLVVGVSSDAFNESKGKKTIIPYKDRSEMVRALRYVDHVFAEDSWDQKQSDIKEYGVSIFGMGADWRGKFDHLRVNCEVVYLERTEGVSSSDLKAILKVLDASHIGELKQALDIISSIIQRFE